MFVLGNWSCDLPDVLRDRDIEVAIELVFNATIHWVSLQDLLLVVGVVEHWHWVSNAFQKLHYDRRILILYLVITNAPIICEAELFERLLLLSVILKFRQHSIQGVSLVGLIRVEWRHTLLEWGLLVYSWRVYLLVSWVKWGEGPAANDLDVITLRLNWRVELRVCQLDQRPWRVERRWWTCYGPVLFRRTEGVWLLWPHWFRALSWQLLDQTGVFLTFRWKALFVLALNRSLRSSAFVDVEAFVLS